MTEQSPLRVSTADRIKDFILSEGLKPGDVLPTEAELCEYLGVSRSSVREAIRTLAALDIIEVRHGHGTFVGKMSLDALVQALVFRGVLSPGDDRHALREIVEVRQALDVAMAEQIIQALSGTKNRTLHLLVSEMEDLAMEGKPFTKQDRAFHVGLLARLDNSLVGQLVAAFWDVHTAVVPKLGLQVASDLMATARAHGDMLDAAEAGNVDAFRTAVAAHYEPIVRTLEVPQVNASA